ncbi:tyrosine-type recombinase/integrase [Ligilactobacillus agilis]|uniref:tyrosine-type recombinase/integrase n=1 Tax=Ligilactobacillus agilis TaxID=1601 RepID=UPI001437CBE9|nr:tyrosine-type recombinase/integrase [Ligilactobacillus agilis]GET09907.1 integrase [Ligilactobacillus agilis]
MTAQRGCNYDSKPLKTKQEIELVRELIKTKTKDPLRNLTIFNIGINNGIRTNDILKLKVSDVLGKDATTIIESKTGKQRKLRLNVANIKDDLADLCKNKNATDYVFTSYKDPKQPIQTVTIYRLFKRLSSEHPCLHGLTAHSMRRTFGYQYYKLTKDVVGLMKMFNHSSQAVTLRYIGIEQEELDESLKGFEL